MNFKLRYHICSLCMVAFYFSSINAQELPAISHGLFFNKVVVWGHKLHTHTHSYIHYGFVKAFKYMGYPVYWLDNNDDIRSIDFSNALFITEGQVDKNIPIRQDCFYIIHNCDPSKYSDLLAKGRCINLQVYVHWCLKKMW